jgi:hypothetical protein
MTSARSATATRRPRTALVAAATLTAGTLALVGAPAAHPQTNEPSGSAIGIAGHVSFLGDPVLDIDETPVVECPPDDADSVAEFEESSGGFGAAVDLLAVECATEDGVMNASATATGVQLELGQLGTVGAEVISAECSANGELSGSSEIVGFEEDLAVDGPPIEISGEPNQTIELGVLTLSFNRQTTAVNPDGTTSLHVDALVIEFPPDDPTVIAVAAVTCSSLLDDEEPPVTEPPVTEAPTPPPAAGPQDTPRTGAPPAVPARSQPTFTG